EIWRECRKQPEHRVASDGNQKHAAATIFIGQPSKHGGADQHTEEEQRTGLQRLWYRQPERLCNGSAGKAHGQNLHGIGSPDKPEYAEKTPLECARTCLIERLFDGNFHAAICSLLSAEDVRVFYSADGGALSIVLFGYSPIFCLQIFPKAVRMGGKRRIVAIDADFDREIPIRIGGSGYEFAALQFVIDEAFWQPGHAPTCKRHGLEADRHGVLMDDLALERSAGGKFPRQSRTKEGKIAIA